MINRKIKSEHFRNLHYYANCRDCDFDAGISKDNNAKKIRYLAKKHVLETGHTVTIEYGGELEYSIRPDASIELS